MLHVSAELYFLVLMTVPIFIALLHCIKVELFSSQTLHRVNFRLITIGLKFSNVFELFIAVFLSPSSD